MDWVSEVVWLSVLTLNVTDPYDVALFIVSVVEYVIVFEDTKVVGPVSLIVPPSAPVICKVEFSG